MNYLNRQHDQNDKNSALISRMTLTLGKSTNDRLKKFNNQSLNIKKLLNFLQVIFLYKYSEIILK